MGFFGAAMNHRHTLKLGARRCPHVWVHGETGRGTAEVVQRLRLKNGALTRDDDAEGPSLRAVEPPRLLTR